jgi:hypothetical protein
MVKSFWVSLLLVIGMTITSLSLSGFYRAQPAQAQQTPLGNNASKPKWEYCAIVDSVGMDDANRKPAAGFVKVGYFEETGYREETIKAPGEVAGIQPSEVYEKARQKALAMAIARLGSQGWELVGELPFGKRFGSDEKERPSLYFKRSK